MSSKGSPEEVLSIAESEKRLAELYRQAMDENELLEFKNYELMFKIQELESKQQQQGNSKKFDSNQQQEVLGDTRSQNLNPPRASESESINNDNQATKTPTTNSNPLPVRQSLKAAPKASAAFDSDSDAGSGSNSDSNSNPNLNSNLNPDSDSNSNSSRPNGAWPTPSDYNDVVEVIDDAEDGKVALMVGRRLGQVEARPDANATGIRHNGLIVGPTEAASGPSGGARRPDELHSEQRVVALNVAELGSCGNSLIQEPEEVPLNYGRAAAKGGDHLKHENGLNGDSTGANRGFSARNRSELGEWSGCNRLEKTNNDGASALCSQILQLHAVQSSGSQAQSNLLSSSCAANEETCNAICPSGQQAKLIEYNGQPAIVGQRQAGGLNNNNNHNNDPEPDLDGLSRRVGGDQFGSNRAQLCKQRNRDEHLKEEETKVTCSRDSARERQSIEFASSWSVSNELATGADGKMSESLTSPEVDGRKAASIKSRPLNARIVMPVPRKSLKLGQQQVASKSIKPLCEPRVERSQNQQRKQAAASVKRAGNCNQLRFKSKSNLDSTSTLARSLSSLPRPLKPTGKSTAAGGGPNRDPIGGAKQERANGDLSAIGKESRLSCAGAEAASAAKFRRCRSYSSIGFVTQIPTLISQSHVATQRPSDERQFNLTKVGESSANPTLGEKSEWRNDNHADGFNLPEHLDATAPGCARVVADSADGDHAYDYDYDDCGRAKGRAEKRSSKSMQNLQCIGKPALGAGRQSLAKESIKSNPAPAVVKDGSFAPNNSLSSMSKSCSTLANLPKATDQSNYLASKCNLNTLELLRDSESGSPEKRILFSSLIDCNRDLNEKNGSNLLNGGGGGKTICQQCKLYQTKVELLTKDRKQLKEQLMEMEEMENDSRLLSQKLDAELIGTREKFSQCRLELERKSEQETRLLIQGKRMAFELKEKLELVQELECQLSKMRSKFVASGEKLRHAEKAKRELELKLEQMIKGESLKLAQQINGKSQSSESNSQIGCGANDNNNNKLNRREFEFKQITKPAGQFAGAVAVSEGGAAIKSKPKREQQARENSNCRAPGNDERGPNYGGQANEEGQAALHSNSNMAHHSGDDSAYSKSSAASSYANSDDGSRSESEQAANSLPSSTATSPRSSSDSSIGNALLQSTGEQKNRQEEALQQSSKMLLKQAICSKRQCLSSSSSDESDYQANCELTLATAGQEAQAKNEPAAASSNCSMAVLSSSGGRQQAPSRRKVSKLQPINGPQQQQLRKLPASRKDQSDDSGEEAARAADQPGQQSRPSAPLDHRAKYVQVLDEDGADCCGGEPATIARARPVRTELNLSNKDRRKPITCAPEQIETMLKGPRSGAAGEGSIELVLKGVAELESESQHDAALKSLIDVQAAKEEATSRAISERQGVSGQLTSFQASSRSRSIDREQIGRESELQAANDKYRQEILSLKSKLFQAHTLNDNLVSELNAQQSARKSLASNGRQFHATANEQASAASVHQISIKGFQSEPAELSQPPPSRVSSSIIYVNGNVNSDSFGRTSAACATVCAAGSAGHQHRSDCCQALCEQTMIEFLRFLLDTIHFHHGQTFELVNECQKLAMNALISSYSYQMNLVHHNRAVLAGNQASMRLHAEQQQLAGNSIHPLRPPPRRRSSLRPQQERQSVESEAPVEQQQPEQATGGACRPAASSGAAALQVAKKTLFSIVPIYHNNGSCGANSKADSKSAAKQDRLSAVNQAAGSAANNNNPSLHQNQSNSTNSLAKSGWIIVDQQSGVGEKLRQQTGNQTPDKRQQPANNISILEINKNQNQSLPSYIDSNHMLQLDKFKNSLSEDIERFRAHFNSQLLNLLTRQNFCESIITEKLKTYQRSIGKIVLNNNHNGCSGGRSVSQIDIKTRPQSMLAYVNGQSPAANSNLNSNQISCSSGSNMTMPLPLAFNN